MAFYKLTLIRTILNCKEIFCYRCYFVVRNNYWCVCWLLIGLKFAWVHFQWFISRKNDVEKYSKRERGKKRNKQRETAKETEKPKDSEQKKNYEKFSNSSLLPADYVKESCILHGIIMVFFFNFFALSTFLQSFFLQIK